MITADELFNENFEPPWLIKEKAEIKEIQDKFLVFVFTLRYGNIESCFKCNRQTKFYLLNDRKCFSCSWCAKQIYPLAGTSLNKSRTPIKRHMYPHST